MSEQHKAVQFGLVDLTEAEQRQVQGGVSFTGGGSARNRTRTYQNWTRSSRGYARLSRFGYSPQNRNPGGCA